MKQEKDLVPKVEESLIDVVMWAKNGQATLPVVLKQINRVIPKEFVNQKIMVDDKSSDHTRQIGLEHGWKVIPNEGHGISDGANTALKNVQTPVFCSFEQDLVVSDEWFRRIFPLIQEENVVVASGVRFSSAPPVVRTLEIDNHKKILAGMVNGKNLENMHGKSFDNTFFKTSFVRGLGGFDYLASNAGQDTSLALKIQKSRKYVWKVDYSVVSLHLRPNSYKNELKHQRWYAKAFLEIFTSNSVALPAEFSTRAFMIRFAKSPISSLKLLERTKNPIVLYYYPAFCLEQLIGLIEGKRYTKSLLKKRGRVKYANY